jgi:hypothetical protein
MLQQQEGYDPIQSDRIMIYCSSRETERGWRMRRLCAK